MHLKTILFTLAWCCYTTLTAQVIVNEAVTSNSVYIDEDGDTPDWLELYNTGSEAVNLTGYYLSDKPDEPQKWQIGNLNLPAGAYTYIWASGKDRPDIITYRTLVNRGATFRYLIPDSPVDANWTTLNFDDTSWQSGATGIGYGDGDDATIVPDFTRSVFLRHTFSLTEVDNIAELLLDMDFDDGFVAYLNGVEIARANIDGTPPAYDGFAREPNEPRIIFQADPARFTVENPESLLISGDNILAIQIHNANDISSDLTCIPFLTARFTNLSNEGTMPPPVLELSGSNGMHTNFKLSASGETVFLNDPAGNLVDSLRAFGLPADVSVGIPVGGGEAQLFAETTPGAENPVSGFRGRVNAELEFSHPGGTTSDNVMLSITGAPEGTTIRVTTDATEPHANSFIYSRPFEISRNTVVRAAAFKTGYLPSPIISATYLVRASHDLPVVTVVTEPDNLFHPVTGMYVLGEGYQGDFPFFGSNIWKDTEHPVHLGFYESDGSDHYSVNGGFKIFGNYSRANAQRSFSLFARGRYGKSSFKYPFFPQRDYKKFQAVVLRNSGNDNNITMLRDVVLTSLMQNSHVQQQAYRSVATYLNGEYWGLYNMREKINEHFLASISDADPDSIDLVEHNGVLIHGSADDYNALVEYASSNPIGQATHYNYLQDRIDMDNYIQYQCAQIYFDNRDWPGNNIKYWRANGGKWRWILFDTDFAAAIWDRDAARINTVDFALETNGPGWPNPPWSTQLFRRLMSNWTFRFRFINQMADEMNSRFLPNPAVAHVQRQANVIRSEMDRHGNRWGQNGDWNDNVRRIQDFFRARPGHMKNHLRQRFNLTAVHPVTVMISDTAQGYVQLNSLTINQNNWTGDYFQGVPIALTAVPKEGYRFVRWELDADGNDPEISMNLRQSRRVRPVFTSDASSAGEPGNTLSLVEQLTVSPNPGSSALRLSFTTRGPVHLTATLFDAGGRQVRQLMAERFGAGTQVQSFGVNSLPKGTYLLRVREANGGLATLRWVKQ